jgi:hypothetical protein
MTMTTSPNSVSQCSAICTDLLTVTGTIDAALRVLDRDVLPAAKADAVSADVLRACEHVGDCLTQALACLSDWQWQMSTEGGLEVTTRPAESAQSANSAQQLFAPDITSSSGLLAALAYTFTDVQDDDDRRLEKARQYCAEAIGFIDRKLPPSRGNRAGDCRERTDSP